MPDSTAREHRTVSRVTTILEAVARNPGGARLVALSTLLDAPKSSIHGLVKGLVATGYLDEDDGLYTLGPAIDFLLRPARPDLLVTAHRSLEQLQQTCDETSMLCSLIGESVVYVDMVESTQMILYSAPLNQRRPMYPTSAGKCFLAHYSPARRASYLRQHVPAERRDAVNTELSEVAQAGFALNRGETVPDVYAAASPIIVGGAVVACLAVAGPKVRMADKLDEVAARLVDEAANVARGRV